MSRSLSSRLLNMIAGEWIPPILRDSTAFGGISRIVFGRRIDEFAGVKEKAPTLTPADLRAFYSGQIARRTQRVSDNTEGVIRRIETDTLPGLVCDVGCGTGHLIGRLARRNDLNAMGVDLNIARDAAPGPHYVESSIERLPFPDRTFTTVISTHTLEHALDIDSAVRELRRIAGRRLIVIVPRERPARYALNAHLHFFVYPWQLALAMRPHGTYRCDRMGSALYYVEDIH